jgi:succinate dehydrogenase/fumarate reductase flavoprotein subunit
MWDFVGPFRTADGLAQGRAALDEIASAMREARIDDRREMNLEWQEWFEMIGMLATAGLICAAAQERVESRGAHQRLDHPEENPMMEANLIVHSGEAGTPIFSWSPPTRLGADPASWTPPPLRSPATTGAGR